MNHQTESSRMLELLLQPAFCVREGIITHSNQAAQAMLIQPGMSVSHFLGEEESEYRNYTGGCLFMPLRHAGHMLHASITRVDDQDIFILEPNGEDPELKAMSLVASKLRSPLFETMLAANRLLPAVNTLGSQEVSTASEQLNKRLNQMHRMICNMSDTAAYASGTACDRSYRDITALTGELLEHMEVLVAACGVKLEYTLPGEPIPTMVDEHLLERALYNLLSNSLKTAPKGSVIQVCLKRVGKRLYFSVQDSGNGIPANILSTAFRRYQREAALEDAQQGLGLGLALVRCAAVAHDGTVLIDQPDGGTRVTLSFAITHPTASPVRSSVTRVDYSGGRDHGLLELSDVLPGHLYSLSNN